MVFKLFFRTYLFPLFNSDLINILLTLKQIVREISKDSIHNYETFLRLPVVRTTIREVESDALSCPENNKLTMCHEVDWLSLSVLKIFL